MIKNYKEKAALVEKINIVETQVKNLEKRDSISSSPDIKERIVAKKEVQKTLETELETLMSA